MNSSTPTSDTPHDSREAALSSQADQPQESASREEYSPKEWPPLSAETRRGLQVAIGQQIASGPSGQNGKKPNPATVPNDDPTHHVVGELGRYRLHLTLHSEASSPSDGASLSECSIAEAEVRYDGRPVREPEPCRFLDTVLRRLLGVALQEAAEHGVDVVAHELAEFAAGETEPPAEGRGGVLRGRNHHYGFYLVECLLRNAFRTLRATSDTPFNAQECRLVVPSSDAKWAELTESDRRHRVEMVLANILSREALSGKHLRVKSADHPSVVYLDLDSGLPTGRAGALILEAEKTLRSQFDPSVELFLPSWEDRNLLRRRTRQVALDGSR